MTANQFDFAWSEAPNYKDQDAFVSDMLLSSALPPDDAGKAPSIEIVSAFRRIWSTRCAPLRELFAEMGLSQTQCSRRFKVPIRTVQSWALGERSCPDYVRLMMAEIIGFVSQSD